MVGVNGLPTTCSCNEHGELTRQVGRIETKIETFITAEERLGGMIEAVLTQLNLLNSRDGPIATLTASMEVEKRNIAAAHRRIDAHKLENKEAFERVENEHATDTDSLRKEIREIRSSVWKAAFLAAAILSAVVGALALFLN